MSTGKIGEEGTSCTGTWEGYTTWEYSGSGLLSKIKYCEKDYASAPSYHSLTFTWTDNTSKSTWDSDGDNCGTITNLENYFFTSICYTLVDSNTYLGIFRLDYDGGSVTIGASSISSCTSIDLTGPIYGFGFINGDSIVP